MPRKQAAGATTAPAKKAVDPEISRGEAELRKLFGDEISFPATQILEDETPEVIPVSPAIDAALGGGVITGTLVTLTGPSGCGKTSTGLKICENWMKLGRRVVYFATEWRLFPRDLEMVAGYDKRLFRVVRSNEGHIMTAQDTLQAAQVVLRNDKHTLVFVDSFSMIGDADEMSGDDYEQGSPAKVNRMVGTFAKRMTPVLPINKNLLIGTFHTYANIGGKTAQCGSVPGKMKFFRSTGLMCSWAEPIKVGKGAKERPIGQVNHWTVERTMLKGGFANAKAASILTYGKGIDANAELVERATGIGLITGDQWRTLAYLGEDAPKFNGKQAVIEHLDATPEHARLLTLAIKERLGDGDDEDE